MIPPFRYFIPFFYVILAQRNPLYVYGRKWKVFVRKRKLHPTLHPAEYLL